MGFKHNSRRHVAIYLEAILQFKYFNSICYEWGFIIENGVQQTTIKLFYWGAHYDSLISYESDKEHIKYFRVKQ